MSFKRTVSMTLESESINQAIKEVRKLRRELTACCEELVRALTEDGVIVAKMNVMSMNAVFTGALEDSISGVFFREENKGIGVIFTDVPYALYVEFGTGIVGERNSHSGDTEIEWEYDINNHGDKGWVYYATFDGVGAFRWTKGMPSRPFMYKTLTWLRENAPGKASEIFSQL